MAPRSEVVVEPDLEHGRRCFAEANWRDAHAAFTRADLDAADLELFAQTAYMLGRDDEYVSALERAHRAHLAAGAPLRALRCAFWIGHSWLFRGQLCPRWAGSPVRGGCSNGNRATSPSAATC
ncbi:hypothetical protein C8D87_101534 [Lentzea atacamensis]|uniref:Uncharacterized protein n=1 Tax=Lentzea atacamensis TaxID=531938 RepID=A0ABX9EI71_9PSEU|nr:hypothetical protein [Lentzea atacamensis]RAS70234.1 hypothetical protein C8D87_101534 [Lentzea atacamensis]